MTMGTVVVTALAARAIGGTDGHDHIRLEADQFGNDVSKSLEPPLRGPAFNDEVLLLHVAEVTQALHERLAGGLTGWDPAISATGVVVKIRPTR